MGITKRALRRILAPRPKNVGSATDKRGVSDPRTAPTFPMEPTNQNVARAMASGLRCVHCGSADHWVGGPRGGMHQNSICGCCGQGVNACTAVPELSHALNELTVLELRAAYEADAGTIRNRAAGTLSARPGVANGPLH